MYKQGYANKATKAVFASLLAASLVVPSGVALAKTSTTDVDDSTITVTGVNANDVVHAYQIFDTDIDANNNLTFTSKVSGLPQDYDTAEKISTATDGRTVANAIASIVVNNSTTTVDATANAQGKATLTLDSGYWLVTVTTDSGNTKVYQTMIVNATPDINNQGKYVTRVLDDAEAKSINVPAPEKNIIDPDTQGKVDSTDGYSVDDIAKFEVSGTLPNYPKDAIRAVYAITDVPDSGLAIDKSSLVVKNGTTVLEADKDYTLTWNADNGYTVSFDKDYILANPGASVTINYDAKITNIDKVTGKVGNTVYGTFTPNPYDTQDVKTDSTDTEDQTYGFYFLKVGADDETKGLAGAKFTVTDETGQPVTYVDAAGTVHTDGVVISDSKGYVHVNGLEAGTYHVKETGVPSGYQAIQEFDVTLSKAASTGDSAATDLVTEVNFTDEGKKVDPKVGELPSTGGAGTVALTAGGILLVVGGSAALLANRRRDQE